MAKWIKCSDRLPVDGGSVMVYAPSADLDCPLITTAWYEPPDSTHELKGWQLLPKVWCEAITHWMPNPAPPVEGGSENG